MAAFATVDDLSAFVGFTVDVNQGNAALSMASESIRSWTGRQIDYVTGDSYTDESGENSFLLPELPVANVSNVQVLGADGVTWVVLSAAGPAPDYTWDRKTGLVTILSIGQPVLLTAPQVQVTYDHGYQTVPAQVHEVCVAIAARILANPLGVQSQTTGGVSVRFDRPVRGVSSLTDLEERMLYRFTTVDVS